MSNNLHQSLLDLLGRDKALELCHLLGNRPFYAVKFKRFINDSYILSLHNQNRTPHYIMHKARISRTTEWRRRKKNI